MNSYRKLTTEETEQLNRQNCFAEDWLNVEVANNFNPANVKNVTFSGEIRMGCFEKEFELPNGMKKQSGIYNAVLHNCIIGNNTYVAQVRNYIANFDVGEGSFINNVDIIEVNEESSFGNGVLVNVLDETGGRNLPIFNELSAHLAYILVLYRHRPDVIEKLFQMIGDYTQKVTSDRGKIGNNVKITNSRIIKNVSVGDNTFIEGVEMLSNGSINSNSFDPVYIGPGVIMEDFIVSSGATVSDSTVIEKCFIGQACVLKKQYSAENSLFFANCAGYHGEACSLFAGPYTVTHHKSTLLIAGMFSFMNAGSGSNQSNHMYKLGPIHQGIVERGAKTTSNSYLLWPAKVGPFTLVMGRHYKNSDTSDLPFSYIVESKDESILAPGVNLRSVGTIRDAQKWPRRDRRKDTRKLDFINFNLLSPYTINKMIAGRDLLIKLKEYSGEKSDFYSYENTKISKASLERGIKLYGMGIDKFLGNSLIKRLEIAKFRNNREIRERLKPDTAIGKGKWVDLAGLIAPVDEISKLMNDIEQGKIDSLKDIRKVFESLHNNYYTYEWTWAIDIIQKETGKNLADFTAEDIIQLTDKWQKSVTDLDEMLYNDAKKEFTLSKQTGFGADGDKNTRLLDFVQVRGDFEKNQQVSAIKDHIEKKTFLGNELIERMKMVKS
ncbi:MAG: DUF4954 family protein [Bacteroidetes bacterium]|nr:DUF4954 family protein [Bacteroidota bacterium]